MPPVASKVIAGGGLNGKAISLVIPPYPPAAGAARASGAVNVQVTVDEGGNVISASAVSGHALLRGAAESAARASKFSPTILSGQPVKVTGVVVYYFTVPEPKKDN
jgi:protein TonB